MCYILFQYAYINDVYKHEGRRVMLIPITQVCKHMKIRTRLTNLSASKRRVSSLFTWNKMDSSYITCFDTCTVARTRRIMVRLHSFERENSSSHPIWKFLRLETARTVTCSRGKIDVKWNDFSVIFCLDRRRTRRCEHEGTRVVVQLAATWSG